jgi:hypothetical protein
MNERIRELKGKTLDKHFSYTWTTMDYDDVSKFAEKFAELIVRECAEVAGCNGHVSGFSLGDLIKQHFGVEEAPLK